MPFFHHFSSSRYPANLPPITSELKKFTSEKNKIISPLFKNSSELKIICSELFPPHSPSRSFQHDSITFNEVQAQNTGIKKSRHLANKRCLPCIFQPDMSHQNGLMSSPTTADTRRFAKRLVPRRNRCLLIHSSPRISRTMV